MWTLIIVDDDPRLVHTLATMARHTFPESYRVHSATRFSDAVAILDGLGADETERLAVLTDHNLGDPRQTGVALLGLVAARHPRSVRFLMSGDDPGLFESSLRDGRVHRFFEKPFLFHDVAAALPRG